MATNTPLATNAPADWSGIDLTGVRLVLDQPPDKAVFDTIIQRAAATAKKVAAESALPFEKLLRLSELDTSNWWKGSTAKIVEAPIGQSGARGVQRLVFGEGTAHHALLVGKTGSGKTNLMHVLITTLALNYSPDEIQLYLIDFKGGVGFKQYATCRLPQARVIAIESEREFGLSVLQGLEAELKRRFDLFRGAGVENLAEYRAKTGEKMPRLLLVVDEFQEFFQPQDDLAQQARNFFERIVRQGRAFGIHILLATQSLSGTAALPSSTQEQMGIRIVLQCSETDARLILADGNHGARQITRRGEGIYNDASGRIEGNKPFQAPLYTDSDFEKCMGAIRRLADERGNTEGPLIFEGNEAARIEECQSLVSLAAIAKWPEKQEMATTWLGEPVAIRPPVAARFQRQAGRNLLIVAREEQEGLGVLCSAWAGLLAHHSPASGVRFLVLDHSNPDSDWNGLATGIQEQFEHQIELLNRRSLAENIPALLREAGQRLNNANVKTPSIYVMFLGLHRVRDLRPDDSAPFRPGEKSLTDSFAQLLRDGPEAGIHVLAWADTLANARRTLDRGMREFGIRVAGAMSVEDSRAFLDEPHAGRLDKPHRVIIHDEDRPGICDKVRPYGIPGRLWLGNLAKALKSRAANNV
jgi:S-DNA-T family DNA segregation ATPase FtsK/SpoIIIE